MKKLLGILAIAGVLVACGNEAGNTESADTTTTTTTDTSTMSMPTTTDTATMGMDTAARSHTDTSRAGRDTTRP